LRDAAGGEGGEVGGELGRLVGGEKEGIGWGAHALRLAEDGVAFFWRSRRFEVCELERDVFWFGGGGLQRFQTGQVLRCEMLPEWRRSWEGRIGDLLVLICHRV
jgi:hypothetical protein